MNRNKKLVITILILAGFSFMPGLFGVIAEGVGLLLTVILAIRFDRQEKGERYERTGNAERTT